MPREARIKTAIWSDRDFIGLPMDAQWLYVVLLSQPGLNQAGVLTIPRRMWANLAGDDDGPDRIAHAWKVLEDRRYVISDDETDELLIRSYIRNDVAQGAPGPFVAALAAATATASPKLRAVLLSELLRLDREQLAAKKPARYGEVPYVAWQRAVTDLGGDPGSAVPDTGSGAMPDTSRNAMSEPPGHAMSEPSSHAMTHAMPNAIEVEVEVEERGSVGNGVTSVGAVADAPDAPATDEPKKPKRAPAERGTRLPEDWLPTRELVDWARERVPAVDTRHETEKFRNYWHAASGAKGVKRDWSATWRNWMLSASERLPSARAAAAAAAHDPATTGRRRVQC
ncbi:hypothetical protein [Pseudonocardia sp. NPDC049635]|uniref:hypothetical protein n=1 Tax=Pseudonocardia sp. NPDC049635 TaxID=3155506 RepID=UPI0033EC70EA